MTQLPVYKKMMNRLSIALIGVILLWPVIIRAQHSHHFFYGVVANENNRKPLEGVNLHIEGTRTGTSTDRKGAFSFFTDTIPAVMTVSHLGFETKSVFLDETSFNLSIYLHPRVTLLTEVEITAHPLESFYQSPQFSVLDYDIDSNQVWLLIYRYKLSKSELICMNLTGDTLAKSEQLTFKPEYLFRDCIGTLHVTGHDSGYQVYKHESVVELIHPVRLKKFEDVLKNCVASSPSTLYFKREIENGLSVEFFGVSKTNLGRKTISKVSDEEKLKMKRRNSEDAWLLNSARPPDSREDFVTWNYVHKVLYRPVSARLLLIGMYACIFNTAAAEIEFYDSLGNYSYKLKMLTGKVTEGRWTKEIADDKLTGKVYTFYLNGGRCTVYEINPDTGVLRSVLILKHVFPEKIRIYNGWVYYLFDEDVKADNKILYRQKL